MKRWLFLWTIVILISATAWAKWAGSDIKFTDIKLIEDNENRTVVEIIPGGFNLTTVEIEGVKHSVIDMPGSAPLLKAGEPELPVLAQGIIIPDQQDVECRVVSIEEYTLDTDPIVPSKGNLSRKVDPAQVPYTFGSVYTRDEVYPQQVVELTRPYIMRDFRATSLRIFPVRYNPVKRTLHIVKRLVVEIIPISGQGENVLSRKGNTINREFLPLYKNLFLNFDS